MASSDQAPVLAGQQTVDEGAHREREAELEQARHDRAAEIEQEQRPVRAVIGEEAAEQRGVGHALPIQRAMRGGTKLDGGTALLLQKDEPPLTLPPSTR